MSRYRLFVVPLLALAAIAACAPAPRPTSDSRNPGELLIQFRMARLSPATGYVPMRAASDGAVAYVSAANIVDDAHVAHASVHRGSSPALVIQVWFTPEGRARLHAATSASVGQHAAMIIGGRLANVALIAGPIGNPDVPVAMGVDVDDRTADELAAKIAAKWPPPAPE